MPFAKSKHSKIDLKDDKGCVHLFELQEIDYFEADKMGNGSCFWVNHEMFRKKETMADLVYTTGKLKLFCLVSKTQVVNVDKVVKFDHRTGCVYLRCGKTISYSDDGLKRLKKSINLLEVEKERQLKLKLFGVLIALLAITALSSFIYLRAA